jgi:hypothetical protein
MARKCKMAGKKKKFKVRCVDYVFESWLWKVKFLVLSKQVGREK